MDRGRVGVERDAPAARDQRSLVRVAPLPLGADRPHRQTAEPDSPATDADAATLIEQVERLLTASETGEGFQRRYYDALQRQPAVVLAHADVRRAIKAMR